MSLPDVTLYRWLYLPTVTLGYVRLPTLTVWTLERPWKDNEPQTSCVPLGRYPMRLEHSPAFNRLLWELKDVPGRSEIKIHPANRVAELKGCIALGLRVVADAQDGAFIEQSRSAVDLLHAWLTPGDATHIEIVHAEPGQFYP